MRYCTYMIHFVMTLNAQFCISKTTAASTVTVPPKCRYLSTRLHHNSSIRHHDNVIHKDSTYNLDFSVPHAFKVRGPSNMLI